MKVQNPFNRQKKRDFVPLSLFPASKVVRTSLPIGRAVPVYCNEMIQGNKIKLTLSEFTRFASLSKPVMNNFRVEFGAYFVPFHSLDAFCREDLSKDGAPLTKWNARKFFNPSTANDERVWHPDIIPSFHIDPSGNLSSGLLNHLGYPISKAPFDWNKVDIKSIDSGADSNLGKFGYLGCLLSGYVVDVMFITNSSSGIRFTPLTYVISSDFNVELPTLTQYIYEKHSEIIIRTKPYYINNSSHSHSSGFPPLVINATSYDAIKFFATSTLTRWAKNELGSEMLKSFGISFTELISEYIRYIQSLVNLRVSSVPAPSTRYLAYNRIYADWFLNELYTDHDTFIDAVGKDLRLCLSPSLGPGGGPSGCLGSNIDSQVLATFGRYISKNECYPVLWSKDRFTACQYEDTMSPTPIGSTITENFFNRMYARFKDLISRMGSDYKNNTSALYGHTISDETLQRSQLVGYKSFDVRIGDIAQTSATDENGRLGQFAGVGVSATDKSRFGDWTWTADENGLFMVLMWVRPMYTSIVNSVDRQIFHKDYFDFLLPHFGGVGYQDILRCELGDFGEKSFNHKFAIQERYSEYMSLPNECSGEMVSLLSDYHTDRYMPENFEPPVKNGPVDFLYMTEKDNLHRIFATGSTMDPVFCTLNFEGTITRQLPATIQTEF